MSDQVAWSLPGNRGRQYSSKCVTERPVVQTFSFDVFRAILPVGFRYCPAQFTSLAKVRVFILPPFESSPFVSLRVFDDRVAGNPERGGGTGDVAAMFFQHPADM